MLEVDHATVFLRNYASLASLAVLFWECVVSFQSELHYIWGTPRNILKSIYLFSRYFGMALQLVNFGLVLMPLSEYPVGPDVCRKWVTFLVAGVTALFCSLQAVVMIRVYFLYNRSATAGCLLAAMFATQCGLGIMSCVQNFGRSKFDRSCNMLGTYNESFYFGGTCVGINIMIWFMTLYKKSYHSAREQRLISTLIHQGAYIMALVFAIVLSGVPMSFVANLLRPTLIFLWPQTFFSISTCRLILSMYRTTDASEQQTHIEGRGTITRDPRLSSMFDMDIPDAAAALDLDREGSRRGSHQS